MDVVYDGDDYEFEISLEPKDLWCFGFKVVYHNSSFLLLQNTESIDISCVLGMEYIENDVELYDREPFTVEVGNTEDIDKIADILRKLGRPLSGRRCSIYSVITHCLYESRIF